jgi:hypothetical protein
MAHHDLAVPVCPRCGAVAEECCETSKARLEQAKSLQRIADRLGVLNEELDRKLTQTTDRWAQARADEARLLRAALALVVEIDEKKLGSSAAYHDLKAEIARIRDRGVR